MNTARTLPLAGLALCCLALAAPRALAAQLPRAPAAEALGDLLDAVPAGSAAACSWTSGRETAPLETALLEVLEAVVDARFDDFALETMELLGASPDVVTEIAALRNLVTTVGGVVPWRALLGEQLVWAQTSAEPLLPGVDCPSMIVLTRPEAARLEQLQAGLAGVLGAVAARLAGPIRYDIHRQPERQTTTYELILRGEHGDRAVVSLAVCGRTLLCGFGQEYFEASLALLQGGDGPRLTGSERWAAAFAGLPEDAAGRSFLDVPRWIDDWDELAELIADRSFNAGFWQGLLNETFQLARALDTVATTVECSGDQLVTSRMTRLAPSTPELLRSGLARPASGALLDYVPHDVVALSSRGDVDLDPAWQWARQRLSSEWSAGEDLLWLAELTQATLDLWIDRDLLSWIGSENLTMKVPSDVGGGVETVQLTRLADKAGARRCIGRIEGVAAVLLPRLVSGVQQLLQDNDLPWEFDLQLLPTEGLYPGLKRLQITAGPLPLPSLTYGFMGDLFVAATSGRALQRCLEVAAGAEDGLWEHPLLAEQLGRQDLCSVSLVPVGQELAETRAFIEVAHSWVRGMVGPAAADDPALSAMLDQFTGLVERVTGILGTIDFLGDALTLGEVRDDGLTRYEVTTQALVGLAPRPRAEASPAITLR